MEIFLPKREISVPWMSLCTSETMAVIHDPKELQCLKLHTSDVTCCDFSPNFTFITGSSDKTVRLWEWLPGEGFIERSGISPLKGHRYGVTCVRVSPQGTMLASTSIDGTAVVWNLHSGVKLITFTQVNGDAIRIVRFAPDSSALITAGDNGAICVWDMVHRSIIRTMHQHDGTTHALAFTPDSQYLVSACSLEIMRVWRICDMMDTFGECEDASSSSAGCQSVAMVDNAHDLGVLSLDICSIVETDPDDIFTIRYTLASGGNNEVIKLWTITTTHLSAKSKGATTGNIIVSMEVTGTLEGHTSAITSVRYNEAGTWLVSASIDKTVKVWDHNGICLTTLEGHGRYVNCAAFSKDSTLIGSGSNDKTIILWDLTGTLSLDVALVRYQHQVGDNNGHHNGERNVIQERFVVREAEDNQNIVKLIEKVDDIAEGSINSCCFYGSNLLATGAGDKMVRIFRVCGETNTLEELNSSPIEAHTYPVNHVDFNKNSLLASSSMEGTTIISDVTNGDIIVSLPTGDNSIRVCKFNSEGCILATAGDDEIATLWDCTNFGKMCDLSGHSDAITSLNFSPDSNIIATTSNNGDFRIWSSPDGNIIHIENNAHDLGIQGCDISENLEPIPNVIQDNIQDYLLATCGADSFIKLWRISFKKDEQNMFSYDSAQIKCWRTLRGHGGTVICVQFSPGSGEILCSTGTDNNARIWSVYSGYCLHVLDHDSIVTCCAFSKDCSLLATGSLDKTLSLWKLPQQLIFQALVANKLKIRKKNVMDWTMHDTIYWLKEINFEFLAEQVMMHKIDGHTLLSMNEIDLLNKLQLDEQQFERLSREIKWLKMDRHTFSENILKSDSIPDDFFCPITHDLMMEPVIASDGFTYERSALTEWFLSGKNISPMTNDILETTDLSYNNDLRGVVAFVTPEWIGNSTGNNPGKFGLWSICTTDGDTGGEQCRGRLSEFTSIDSLAFQGATVAVGLAVLTALMTVCAMCFFFFCHSTTVYHVCAWLLLLSAVCMISGCIAYPAGWSSVAVQRVCGPPSSAIYSLATCSIRWAYLLAAIGCLDAVILATLAFILATRHIRLQPDPHYAPASAFKGEMNSGFVNDSGSMAGSRKSLNLHPVLMMHPGQEDTYSQFSQRTVPRSSNRYLHSGPMQHHHHHLIQSHHNY